MGNIMTGPVVSLDVRPVPQAPPRPTRSGRNLLSTVVLAVALGWAAHIIELRPLELLRDLGEKLALLQENLQGEPLTIADLPLALVPHPLGGIPEEEVVRKADLAVPAVLKAVLRS